MDQPGNKEKNLKVQGNKWKWKHNGAKPLGCSKSRSKKEVYSNTGLPQEAKKISIYLKEARKKTTNKTPNQQKEGNDNGKSGNKWYRI